MPYIFLNPDGSENLGLNLIVEHPTGVLYGQQCAGLLAEIRTVEGFLIPVGGPDAARRVHDWFWKTFPGNCYPPIVWTEDRIRELAGLVAQVPCWLTRPGGEGDERHSLVLDEGRLDECVEAWIPVRTPYGRGILVLENLD
jgi:hypothetical protein